MNPQSTKKTPPPHIVDAWTEYRTSGSEKAKDILVSHYAFLVKHIVRPFERKKPFLLDRTDLIQAGTIGLIQALERFDHSKGFLFETFAQQRIRGAILDEINSLDWTPRSVRKNIRVVMQAEEQLLANGEEATNSALGEATGLTIEEIAQTRHQATKTFVLPVNQESMREIETHLTELEAERAFSHFLDATNAGTSGQTNWAALTKNLTPQEKRVLFLRFYFDETVGKTALILNISNHNVSMIQKSALSKLRQNFLSENQD